MGVKENVCIRKYVGPKDESNINLFYSHCCLHNKMLLVFEQLGFVLSSHQKEKIRIINSFLLLKNTMVSLVKYRLLQRLLFVFSLYLLFVAIYRVKFFPLFGVSITFSQFIRFYLHKTLRVTVLNLLYVCNFFLWFFLEQIINRWRRKGFFIDGRGSESDCDCECALQRK